MARICAECGKKRGWAGSWEDATWVKADPFGDGASIDFCSPGHSEVYQSRLKMGSSVPEEPSKKAGESSSTRIAGTERQEDLSALEEKTAGLQVEIEVSESDQPAPTDQQDVHSDNVEATPPMRQGVLNIGSPTTNVRIVDIDLSFSQWVVLIMKTTLAGLVAMLVFGFIALIAVMVVDVPDWGSWFSNTPSATKQCTYYAGDAPAVSRRWTVTVDGLTCPMTSTRGEWTGNLQR